MNEKTLNKFLVGATVDMVFLYPLDAAIHILFDDGVLLTVNCTDPGVIKVDISGPSQPEAFEMEAE